MHFIILINQVKEASRTTKFFPSSYALEWGWLECLPDKSFTSKFIFKISSFDMLSMKNILHYNLALRTTDTTPSSPSRIAWHPPFRPSDMVSLHSHPVHPIACAKDGEVHSGFWQDWIVHTPPNVRWRRRWRHYDDTLALHHLMVKEQIVNTYCEQLIWRWAYGCSDIL